MRIALVDDPLVVWTPQGESEQEQRRVIDAFCQMLQSGQDAGNPHVAGYVSRPGHRDVIGALRLTLCASRAVPIKPQKSLRQADAFDRCSGIRPPATPSRRPFAGLRQRRPQFESCIQTRIASPSFILNAGNEIARD